jgi:D-aminoacyl-tRNA deacylase
LSGESKITIVCSTQDRASQNIKNNLLNIREWKPVKSSSNYPVFEFKDFRIVEIDEGLIYQDGLDKKLTGCGLCTDLLIFASKHRSKDGRAIFTVHSTGNVDEAKFGGRDKELATAAPQAVGSLLRSLKILAQNEDYEVTLECTHHGPSELKLPSLFIEIGSGEAQWIDEVAGRIAANAILLIKNNEAPVAVGFGGTHYAPRQNALILETDVTFGHIFPNHALDKLDENLIKQAFMKSNADFAYFDRKSMKAKQRDALYAIIKKLGYEVLRESDIRDMDGIPREFCLHIRQKVRELCPSGRAKITNGIKCELLTCQNCICPKVKVARINPVLLAEAEKIDKKRLENFLSHHNIAYMEYENGRFSHVILGLDDNCARIVAEELTGECIKILETEYDVTAKNGTIEITEKKFSPELASSFGIHEGPLFGELARGETIFIDGKTINPEMVYEINKRAIKLN